MTEKYIVIDTSMKSLFVAGRYVSETPKFIHVEVESGATRKRSKDSVNIVSTHDTMEEARKAAEALTSKLRGARKHYDQRVAEIIAQARGD